MVALKQEAFALSPRELIAQIGDLPSLPAIYFRVKAVIERPDSSIRDIEREISYDAGLTSRLLCLANSVHYSVRGRLDSIGQAFSLLGTEQVKHLLLATSVASAFRGISPQLMNMRKFWHKNAYRALIAQGLASQDHRFDGERFFVEGLLSDIGHLVMYLRLPQAAEKALLRSQETGAPLHRVEREVLGFDYAEVSADQSSDRSFQGSSSYEVERRLLDDMTVTVMDVLPNGNLVIEGSKYRRVSNETRLLRLSGIVRPYDIGIPNIIESRFIANPRIVYEGGGVESRFTNQGWLGRATNKLWPY